MKRNLIYLLIIVFVISIFSEEIKPKRSDFYSTTPKFEVIRQVNWDSLNRNLTGEIKINISINNEWAKFIIPINLKSEMSSSFIFTRDDKNCISTIKCPSLIKTSNLLRIVPCEERTNFVADNVEAACQIEILKASNNCYNLIINFYHLLTKFNIIHTGEFNFTSSWSDEEPFPIVINWPDR